MDKMTNEIALKYLYYLTHMNSGGPKWKECYNAWKKFAEFIGHEEYEEIMKELTKFDRRYRIKT